MITATKTFIENIEIDSVKQRVRLYGFYKPRILLKRIIQIIKIYDEEFDPGSGWTLAAGLTHASRGAAFLVY